MSRTRREFLRDLAVSAPFVVSPGALAAVGRDQAAAPPWDRAAAILRRIVPPRFPSRHFEITRFGAIGDGRADCTSAIRRAIAACRAAGGGRVVVPPGRFVTGAIKLASGTELHLTPKATLAFSRDAKHYLPIVTRAGKAPS
jgi:polygalacturonase